MNKLEEAISAVQNAISRAEHAEAGGALLQKTDLTNILSLLKAQEPRVIALEEARKRDISYVELRAEDYILPCIVGSPGDGDVIHVKPLSEGFNRIFPRRDYYGKDWRCWTSCPTNEQREATPWDQ